MTSVKKNTDEQKIDVKEMMERKHKNVACSKDDMKIAVNVKK